MPSLVLHNHALRDVNEMYRAVNCKVSNMVKSNAPNSIDHLSIAFLLKAFQDLAKC